MTSANRNKKRRWIIKVISYQRDPEQLVEGASHTFSCREALVSGVYFELQETKSPITNYKQQLGLQAFPFESTSVSYGPSL
jgi:hypothetical protein